MNKPTHREVEIIGLRLNGKSLEEIGQEFGISRERVRQILKLNGIDTSNAVYSLTCQHCEKSFRCAKRQPFCSTHCERTYWRLKNEEKRRAEGVQEQARSLSPRNIEIMLYIHRTRRKTGESPTTLEIARWCDMKPNQVGPVIKKLRERGLVGGLHSERRALFITDKGVDLLKEKGVRILE